MRFSKLDTHDDICNIKSRMIDDEVCSEKSETSLNVPHIIVGEAVMNRPDNTEIRPTKYPGKGENRLETPYGNGSVPVWLPF